MSKPISRRLPTPVTCVRHCPERVDLVGNYVDVSHFIRSSGSRALLAIVCEAFLTQIPKWRDDFEKANQRDDRQALQELLHKMKGCCYAVSATQAALTFDAAEQTVMTISQDAWVTESAQLLALLVKIESELPIHAAPSV